MTLTFDIANFIIAQPFAKHRFLKNTSAWLLPTSKFFSEFDSMFCYHKVRMLQKGFSQLFFAWSVKWWVSLKLWNNHLRDWINNLFHLKNSFRSRDVQISVFQSFLLPLPPPPFPFPVSHYLRGWSTINLKVYDVSNCLNKNLTHFAWCLAKEKRYDIELCQLIEY